MVSRELVNSPQHRGRPAAFSARTKKRNAQVAINSQLIAGRQRVRFHEWTRWLLLANWRSLCVKAHCICLLLSVLLQAGRRRTTAFPERTTNTVLRMQSSSINLRQENKFPSGWRKKKSRFSSASLPPRFLHASTSALLRFQAGDQF